MIAASTTRPDTLPELHELARLAEARVERWVERALDSAASGLASSRQGDAQGGREQTAAVLALLRDRRRALLTGVATALRRRLTTLPIPSTAARAAAPSPSAASDELSLSLIDEEQIDEEIETARIVQLIEAEAEVELQELSALASRLMRLDHVDPAALPLRPPACAQGLREGLAEGLAGVSLDPAARLLLLRALGGAIGLHLRREYAELAERLRQWGVKPAPFRIRPTSGGTPRAAAASPGAACEAQAGARTGSSAGAGREAGPDADADTDADGALQKLVRWARETAPAALDGDADAPATDPGAPLQVQLLDEPRTRAHRDAEAPLPRAAAEHALGHLFAQLGELAELPPATHALLAGLHRVGQRLSAQDGSLWSNAEHPWWKLIDRLLAIGAAHDELGPADQHRLHDSLGGVLGRLQQAPRLEPAMLADAADDLRAVAASLLQGDAGALMEQVSQLQLAADRQELKLALRAQLQQQLRSTRVSAALRHFLVGPWTLAMAGAAQRHGQASAQLAALAAVVDDLIRATAMAGRPVSATQRVTLLRQVEAGLALSGLPAAQARAELGQLAGVLHNPPPADDDPGAPADEAPETLPAGLAPELHAGLPTVPLDLAAATTPEAAAGASDDPHAAWLASLHPGTRCHLFLQGGWITTRLHWVSPNGGLFLFAGRPHGRTHSLTKRMLLKLRAAGLATSLGDGARLARAIDTLTADTRR